MLPCGPLVTPTTIPPPSYMTYTSLLLLQSSSLLLNVGLTGCMDSNRPRSDLAFSRWERRRRTQDQDIGSASASEPLDPVTPEDMPPPVPPKDTPAVPTIRRTTIERSRRVPNRLRPLIRRRSDENDISPLDQEQTPSSAYSSYSYPPVSGYETQYAPRSAPSTMTTFPSSSLMPPPAQWGESPTSSPSELFLPSSSSSRLTPPHPASLRRTQSGATPATYHRYESSRASQSNFLPPTHSSSFSNSHRQMELTEEPFDCASDFHLFVEATSGLPPPGVGSPTNNFESYSHSPNIAHRSNSYANASPTAQHWQQQAREYYSPRPSSVPPPSVQRLSTQPYSQNEAPSTDQLFAAALTGEDQVIDEELPDYEQSQLEASTRQRREATRRAAELEARWATARRGRS
ncbi:hypothetical protein K402DRAFT_420866 [Aulographum hederae CBS 113979]|uniref:Uncharacterized protein n=1 Tax=Aulographum hederae CBS 113979 TaxID=1176131 RepID=A0A6G1H0T0_9PEZI|nr:hypothetical protein K402DRAFT_420866 [Aulographum hederae CBS 113979]